MVERRGDSVKEESLGVKVNNDSEERGEERGGKATGS